MAEQMAAHVDPPPSAIKVSFGPPAPALHLQLTQNDVHDVVQAALEENILPRPTVSRRKKEKKKIICFFVDATAAQSPRLTHMSQMGRKPSGTATVLLVHVPDPSGHLGATACVSTAALRAANNNKQSQASDFRPRYCRRSRTCPAATSPRPPLRTGTTTLGTAHICNQHHHQNLKTRGNSQTFSISTMSAEKAPSSSSASASASSSSAAASSSSEPHVKPEPATFVLGELVWAKMDAHCAWPAQVVHPQGDYAAREIRKRKHANDKHRNCDDATRVLFRG